MARIPSASWRAKAERMSYRQGKHHKTPGLVFCQQVLAKQDFSDSLWTKFGACRKRLKLSEHATDIEGIMNKVI